MVLVIFHYHFMTGGVTSVIVQAIKALSLEHTFDSYTLVSGKSDNTDALYHKLSLSLPQSSSQIHIDTHPLIDYRPYSADTPRHRKEIGHILSRYCNDQTVWWVHNWHLGKNVAFTAAMYDVISSCPSQKIILQIHDFPEQGRDAQMQQLASINLPSLYPVRSGLAYAVINSHDKKMLHAAGIPLANTHLLPNPIGVGTQKKVPSLTAKRMVAVREKITSVIPAPPDTQLMLYPVRAIRRKNILEAGLIVSLLNHIHAQLSNNSERRYALITTLTGTSLQEQAYSSLIQSMYQQGLIYGIWNIDSVLNSLAIEYQEVFQAIDMAISSSILEGFGYTFAEALIYHKPLIARTIDALADFVPYYAPSQLLSYPSLRVEWQLLDQIDSNIRPELHRHYMHKIDAYHNIPARTTLTKEVEALVGNSHIDFSLLTIPAQTQLLQCVEVHAHTLCKNNPFLQVWYQATRPHQGNIHPKLYDHLSDQQFVARFENIVHSLAPNKDADNSLAINPAIDLQIHTHMTNLQWFSPLTQPFTEPFEPHHT